MTGTSGQTEAPPLTTAVGAGLTVIETLPETDPAQPPAPVTAESEYVVSAVGATFRTAGLDEAA